MSEPTAPLPAFDGEVLGPPESSAGSGGGGRRFAIVGVIAGLVAALLGGAAFAAYQFLNGGGPRPEEALPSDTIMMASIDLDPRAGQKIEAIKTLRKFPALRESLGLQSQDDLRKYVFDEAVPEGECDGLDYADDVKPWIGKRAGFALVDLGEDFPSPAIALHIEDPAKARAGMTKIADCIDSDEFAFEIGEDYAIASDSAEHAKEILASGKKKPLADDKTFRKWFDEVGDEGVASLYLAPAAGTALLDAFGGFMVGPGEDDFAEGFEASGAAYAPGAEDDPFADLREQLEEFKGAAGTLRFADGGLEFAFAGDAGDQGLGDEPVGPKVAALPADTALAAGLSISDDFSDQMLGGMMLGSGGLSEAMIEELEKEAGIDFPDDIQTLLGKAVTFSVGGDAPSSLEEWDDPGKVPAGVVIHGDPDDSLGIIHKIEKGIGTTLDEIPIETEQTDDTLVLSPSSDYAKALTKNGELGDTDAFSDAVPDADKAGGIFFLVLDKGWRKTLVELADADGWSAEETDELAENLEPFEAIGISSTIDGDVSHVTLRISTR